MNENRHHIPEVTEPVVRVVVIPGILVHTTEEECAQAESQGNPCGKPWPGIECEERAGDQVDQYGYSAIGKGETCPHCGHPRPHVPQPANGYIDYALEQEPGTALGEPISAGEACECPCHKIA